MIFSDLQQGHSITIIICIKKTPNTIAVTVSPGNPRERAGIHALATAALLLVVPERMVLASEENTAPGGFDADRVGASGLDSGIALPRKRPKQDWGDPELFPVLRLLAPVTIELDR